MSDGQLTVLQLMAMASGTPLAADEIVAYCRPLIGSDDARSALLALRQDGLIVEAYQGYADYYPNRYKLASGQLLPLLRPLAQPQAAERLKRMEAAIAARGKQPGDTVRYALRLLAPKGATTATGCADFPKGTDFIDELAAVLTKPDFHDCIAQVPEMKLAQAMRKATRAAIIDDADIDWAHLRRIAIDDRPTAHNRPTLTSLRSGFNLCYYLATGKMCVDLASLHADEEALETAAIQQLYRGDAAKAHKLFAKAMTLHNRMSDEKGVFGFLPLDYYYVLSILLTGTEVALKRFDSMLGRRIFSTDLRYNMLLVPLHVYFRQHKAPDIHAGALDSVTRRGANQPAYWLSWMTLSRLGAWPPAVKAPSLSNHQPRGAWLRAELMPTGVIPANDEAQRLLGPSLFHRLEVKPVWQVQLEEIIHESQEGDAPASERPTRLIYMIDFGEIVPVLQKRKKSGGWSVGRRLTPDAFARLTDEDATLDETDQRLMQALNEWDSHIDEERIAQLVGCDHVFTGSQSDPIPVSIHEDKPYLLINKSRDGSFNVSTNVDELAKDDGKTVMTKRNSDTDYSVYRPSPFERRVYRQILSHHSFPKEAEPLIMQLIAAIGGRTEIHSNMVVDLDDLKKVEGDGRLTLRCQPDSHEVYRVSVAVHALPGVSFAPGKGNKTTIAEQDGERVQLVRSLTTERHNLRLLCEELADLGVLGHPSDFQPNTLNETLAVGIAPFLELMQWVKDNPHVAEMEWPEGVRVKYRPSIGTRAATIGFKAKNGWFEVEGDVRVDEGEALSLRKLLELMHAAGRRNYIKIGEREYVSLSGELAKILRRLDTVTTDRRGRLQMAPAAAGLMGDVLDGSDAQVSRSPTMEALRKRIKEAQGEAPRVPATLQATLREYQLEGYEWLARVTAWGAGACLADDMGLGKTLQTITLLLARQQDGPSLVVAPASVVPNWRNELQRFAPTLRVILLNDAADRAAAIGEATAGMVVVATYALLNIQQEQLGAKEWNIVCLDEAHTIKNPTTKVSRAAMTLQAKRRVELTGTPIQNHLSELWNLFQFLNPGLLGSLEQFQKKFIEPIEGNHDKERQGQLRRLISPFLLRRTKGEVIGELPDKDEIILPVELSADEMAMYEVRRRHAEEAVLADKRVKVSTLAEITKLRQLACSPALVDKRWRRASSKVLAFLDLAEGLSDSGNRALVFSQFTSFLDEVRAAMEKAGLPYLYLDGSTPMHQREQLVSDFQHGNCPFFLISLKAGGLGLNLTGANYVVHLDPWWNPAIEQQATDRAYRIGQKQDVTVYHLIAQHTIEEKILRLHKTKRGLADSLLEGSDMSHALTQEELLELLK